MSGSIQEITAGVRRDAIAIGVAMRPVVQAFRRAADQFGEAFYRMAEAEYRRHHDKLPGSNRTSRLRKKRRTEVMRWFVRHLDRLGEQAASRSGY